MTDTIAAIASGMTASGIGIIRISGPEAFLITGKIFRFAGSEKKIEDQGTNTIHHGFIYDKSEKIDEVLVLLMRSPHTYTAEDTAEIDCHGGPYVMQRILTAVLAAGARLAEPGEFTKRAFLNGRIDLTEAEAVMDVIEAKSGDALSSSLSQLGGSVKNEITDLRSGLMAEIAYIEASLDDPEHMDLTGYPERLRRKLNLIAGRLNRLIQSFAEGRIIREGIATVILGKPNAGKSSILNVLTGTDRAIVTDIAGTTRDTIEETVRLDGISLRIADTAGIRETGDEIEKIGVSRALNLAGEADLILPVFDSSRPLDEDDREIFRFIRNRKAIVLLNKSDLPSCISEEDIRRETAAPVILISAKEKTGIGRLAETIREMFFSGKLRINEETMLTNVRHKTSAEAALKSISCVLESIQKGLPEDFYSIDLMDAYASLGNILGEEVDDDLIDAIFSKFCLGK